MSETPRSSEGEPNPFLQEVITALRGMREVGVDFEESDIEHLAAMEEDELYEYVYVALLEAGVNSPEEVMIRIGIVEAFRKYNQAEIESRLSRTLRGEDYRADEVDELDRREGRGSHGRQVE